MRKRIAYRNIAEEAGISISTVSRVISNPEDSSHAMRTRVIDAVFSLGGDPADYGLVPQSEGRVIIFNVPSPSNPFYLPIIEAARKRAESGGYILLENESDLSSSSSMDRFLSMLITTKAAGTIIANAMTCEGIARIGRAVPAVMCSESAEGSDVPYVIIDNAGAAYSAVRYLLSSGRRRIAMLNGPSSYMYSGDRYSGYRRALLEAGYPLRPEYSAFIGSHMDLDMAYVAVRKLLDLPEPPDAIFCISDMLAALAIHAACDSGVSVPDDLAVIGFDDQPVCRMVTPSISTVRQPVSQMGALSAEMMIRMIADPGCSLGSIKLDTELIIRESA